MKFLLPVMVFLLAHPASAAVYKRVIEGTIEHSDKPCSGAVVITLAPAPPVPVTPPRRLIVEPKVPSDDGRNNTRQMRKMCAAIRNVEKHNLALRDSIRALEKQKESELRNAALGNRETRYQQMTTINLYWNSRIDALQREYDRNLHQIERYRSFLWR